ncbi:hypothetical protein BD779DRAFT_1667956 [Infundibulicybe gibba]|nr:hypothetical protein BD779DRAFT_1667956 [Infundibulicybe gibba]
MDPPAYQPTPTLSEALHAADDELSLTDILPEYSHHESALHNQGQPRRRAEMKEFEYTLVRKGKSWVTLTVLGYENLSSHIPTIVEGSSLAGSLKLALESADTIQGVTISITGQIITGANPGEQFTFVELSETLWTQAMGDPRNPAASGGDKFSGKLLGDYNWNFSLKIPQETVVNRREGPRVFKLPQTFAERHTRPSIQYNISARLSRGKLRTDYRRVYGVQASFGYVPTSQPDPPSPLRQLAYQENSPLMGPAIDPEGWQTLGSVNMRGRVFNQRPIDIKCTLSLAKPLCYTKGSLIPMTLVLDETDDEQALDLLSSPKAIVVRLRRCVRCHADETKSVDTKTWKDEYEDSQLASWWPSPTGVSDSDRPQRELNGELHLKGDLKPTSSMAHFRIEYSVVLFPFDIAAFESADTEPLLVQPVEIMTTFAPGPRPRMYTPPGYESPLGVGRTYLPYMLTRGGFL